VFVGVLTIAVAGVALVELLRAIERRVEAWRPLVGTE
jgi:ABC-type nitrate/sulfonate/bicarbonate transport system permease component